MFNRFKTTLLAAAAVTALGMAGSAQAVVTITPTPIDTVTDLGIAWTWDSTGGTVNYLGTNWDATITATEVGSIWTVDTWYTHLDGPHGETAEPAAHLHSISFTDPGGSASLNGVENHDLLQHVNFHQWSLAGNATVTGGAATLSVLHPVPEPETWALMLLGLGGLAAGRRKIRS